MFVGIVPSSKYKYEKKSKKLRLNLMMSSLALATLIPVNFAFAEEVATSDETSEKAKRTNESTLNWLESEDYIFAAERIPTNRWDTPANVHVITAQEIEDNHYQTIGEALSHVNGIMVRDMGMNMGGGHYVQLDGINRVVLLVDGRRMLSQETYAYQNLKSDLTILPSIKMVERIEIVKGGMSALYGSDAVGGVINIITKKGTRNETTVDINSGSWKTHNYEITNQGVKGKFSWFITGGLQKIGYSKAVGYDYNFDNSYFDNNGEYHSVAEVYKEKSKYGGSDNNTASIRLDNRFDDSSSLTLTGLHHEYYNQTTNNISLSYNFKEGTATPGWFRYFDDKLSYKTPGTRGISADNNNQRVQGIGYQNGWQFGRHTIIAGFEWYKNHIDTNMANIVYNGESTDTAAYLQDTIKLGNKWTIIPGVRFDHDSDGGNNWSPKLSVNYRADDKTKFYGSWGRVYNSPADILRHAVSYGDSMFLGSVFNMRGNPDLRNEKGHVETIGMEHAFDDNTSVALNYFHSNMHDVVHWAELDEHLFSMNGILGNKTRNVITEKRNGIELNFNKKFSDKWRIHLGYTRINGKDIWAGMLYGTYFVTDNSNYGSPNGYRVGIHYTCGRWKGNLFASVGEGLDSAAPAKVVVLDLNVSYDVRDDLTFYARARNITNQVYEYALDDGSDSPARFFQVGAVCRF